MKQQKAIIVSTLHGTTDLNGFLSAGWRVVQMSPLSGTDGSYAFCLVIIES